MNASWVDTFGLIGPATRVKGAAALKSRPGLSFVETRGGRVRLLRAPSSRGPRLVFAADGPNVLEHYDALLRVLEGRADVVVFEPPGTGGSAPKRGFDFTLTAFTQAIEDLLLAVGPRTLTFPCYLGFIAQQLAQTVPALVQRLVLPQTPAWADLDRWADGVDPRRLLRTPVLGQLLVGARRRSVARSWYRASTGDRRFREPFIAAADEAFDWGGCFCLASLMQGFGRSVAPASPVTAQTPTVVLWGSKDRTHRHSNPEASVVGGKVVRFDDCGHSPELEAPERFADWLLAWHDGGL